MADPYFDWIDREARQSKREQDDVRLGRFLPKEPDFQTNQVVLHRDETCSICRNPLFPGEIAFVCETTHQVGCCQKHCQEAAETKLQLMGVP